MDDKREQRDDQEQRDSEDVARPGSTIKEQEAGKGRHEIGDKTPEDTRKGQQQTG